MNTIKILLSEIATELKIRNDIEIYRLERKDERGYYKEIAKYNRASIDKHVDYIEEIERKI